MSNITGDNFTPQNVAKNNAQNTDDYAVILPSKSNQDVRENHKKKKRKAMESFLFFQMEFTKV